MTNIWQNVAFEPEIFFRMNVTVLFDLIANKANEDNSIWHKRFTCTSEYLSEYFKSNIPIFNFKWQI